MKTSLLLFLVGATLALSIPATASVVVDSSTENWTPITYANPNQADPSGDHQTGITEGDIVGNAGHASFYTNYSEGQIGFRARVAGDSNPSGFNTNLWIGIDANLDGTIDIFLGAKDDTAVGIYSAGLGLNISPNTTSLDATNFLYEEAAVEGTNFSFTQVNSAIDPGATNFNLDSGSGGGTDHNDYFLSLALPLNQLAAAINGLSLSGIGVFDENSPLRYIVATSTQDNSLNQDLNGLNGDNSSQVSWVDLGGFSDVFSSTGQAIPEPSTLLLSLAGLLMLLRRGSHARN